MRDWYHAWRERRRKARRERDALVRIVEMLRETDDEFVTAMGKLTALYNVTHRQEEQQEEQREIGQ